MDLEDLKLDMKLALENRLYPRKAVWIGIQKCIWNILLESRDCDWIIDWVTNCYLCRAIDLELELVALLMDQINQLALKPLLALLTGIYR